MTTERSFQRITLDLQDITIKPFDPSHDRTAFCCGVRGIDNFCRYNARKQHEKGQVRVYDAVYEGHVVGYYYLIASARDALNVSDEAAEKFARVRHAPCVYLGMIGVTQRYQGNNIGRMLMAHAMRRTLAVADVVGVYALVLDALNEQVVPFYERLGFQRFARNTEGAEPVPMFIPIQTIRSAG